MTSISNGESGLSVRTKLNSSLTVTDAFTVSSGNVGIGVTPSAWGVAFRSLQVGALTSISTESSVASSFANNGFYGGNWAYLSSGLGATNYSPYNGEHRWFVAPSGTAGNAITFTQAMTLNASGNLGIGTTSPTTRLHVFSSTGDILSVDGSGTTTGAADTGATMSFKGHSGSVASISFGRIGAFKENSTVGDTAGYTVFTKKPNGSGNVEAMRIDSSGNVGIGASAPASKLELRGASPQAITISHTNGTGYDTSLTSTYSATQSLSLVSAGFSVLSFRPADSAAVIGAILRLDRGASAPVFWLNGASGTDQVGLKAGSGGLGAMEFYTGAAERMRITSGGNVGIGTASPNAAAIVDAQSTTKGVRFPNMTTTEKNLIANVAGNVVFDTTLGKLCVNSGSGWQTITSV